MQPTNTTPTTTSSTASELPYQTYERLTGNTWTGGNTAPILSAYKQYGITNAPGSASANLALQAALIKGSAPNTSSPAGTIPTPTATPTGVTVPPAPTGTNPVVSSSGDRSSIDALGSSINNMADTSGLTSAYNTETGALNDRMTQLEQDQQDAITSINQQFDEAQAEQTATNQKDYAGTSTNLATAGGGFLGYTGSQGGVLSGLKQTFNQESTALAQKRDAAIQQAKSAYDDKSFAVAESLASEAKSYQDDLYQKQKDYASNQLALAQENRSQSEFEGTQASNKLQALATADSGTTPITLDPDTAKSIDSYYGVPGFTQQYLDTSRQAAAATSQDAQQKSDIAVQTLLTKVPAGQTISVGGKNYVGLKKAATGSTSDTISPLIIQQIPQLAPLAGQKQSDIILSLDLSTPPAWFTQTLASQQGPYAPGKAPTVDPQTAWDAFRNDPDLMSYRNTVRLNKNQSLSGSDPAALAASLKEALGLGSSD